MECDDTFYHYEYLWLGGGEKGFRVNMGLTCTKIDSNTLDGANILVDGMVQACASVASP
jgi:hypothetical protein